MKILKILKFCGITILCLCGVLIVFGDLTNDIDTRPKIDIESSVIPCDGGKLSAQIKYSKEGTFGIYFATLGKEAKLFQKFLDKDRKSPEGTIMIEQNLGSPEAPIIAEGGLIPISGARFREYAKTGFACVLIGLNDSLNIDIPAYEFRVILNKIS